MGPTPPRVRVAKSSSHARGTGVTAIAAAYPTPEGQKSRISLERAEGERDRLVEAHLRAMLPGLFESGLVELTTYRGQRFRVSLLLVERNAHAGFLVQVQRAREKPCGGLHPTCPGMDRRHAAQAVELVLNVTLVPSDPEGFERRVESDIEAIVVASPR